VWDASRAALVAALYLTFASYGCTRVAPRRSQLEGVSQAALRIKSSIGIGSYRLENASLDDLAYQIALAKRLHLDSSDLQAVAYYERALQSYLAANEVWKVGREFRDCEVRDPIPTDRAVHEAQARCFARYGEEIRNASAVAQISIDDVEHKRPDNLLKRAADEIEQAERARAK
jgi:hypothetical protein